MCLISSAHLFVTFVKFSILLGFFLLSLSFSASAAGGDLSSLTRD